MLNKRASGVLMHISSLPGDTGIGTLGKSAYDFVDYLKRSAQSYWQILPVCPTSFGDSPYQSFSTFAGNPYFIDLDILCSQGFLQKADYDNIDWGNDPTCVDYALLYKNRFTLFNKLYDNFKQKIPDDYNSFCETNAFWLDDYALFMAIKDAHGGISFNHWEKEIRCREPQALASWKEKTVERVQLYKMIQYFFFKQWFELKNYANKNGIKIIGDIPIYVAADSADVWASPELFCLDENSNPVEIAGCPPDGFSAIGQLWGNPVYNWDYMRAHHYEWWCTRLEKNLKTYDVLRIDHFRGFESYYCIPYGASTAANGQWRKGPGLELFNVFKQKVPEPSVIAEDLGFLTDNVRAMLKDSGFPGMKVLQFAFDSRETNDYLPCHFTPNSVVYTGTHDNDTILGWTESAPANDVAYSMKYLRVSTKQDVVKGMMTAALSSISNTCILTMQDIACLGSEARMNTPSTVGKNWRWRIRKDQLTQESSDFLRTSTTLYGRTNVDK
jgi:4-alpha-glucanotransferase